MNSARHGQINSRKRAAPVGAITLPFLLLLLLATAPTPVSLFSNDSSPQSDQAENQSGEHPVDLVWGVPDDVQMGAFDGLPRLPEDKRSTAEGPSEDAAPRTGGTQLELLWEEGESYVLPLFASSEYTLDGVRYFGHSIPLSFELEWLDVRTGRWHPIDEIPSELILMRSQRQNDHRSIEFGPPEGAAFRHDKVRFIWFRVTPQEAGEFSLELFAFQPEDEDRDNEERDRTQRGHESPAPISEELVLEAEVKPAQ